MKAMHREAYSWSRAVQEKSFNADLHNLLPLHGICLNFIESDSFPALVSPWCEEGNLFEYVTGTTEDRQFIIEIHIVRASGVLA